MEPDDWASMMLETETLEELLERFNITPEEAFKALFNIGMIDEDLMNGK